jgi:WRKY transcription factor 2
LQAQPSPTTGKLPFLVATDSNSTVPPAAKINEDCAIDSDIFSFQPHLVSKEPGFSTAANVISYNVSVYHIFSFFLVVYRILSIAILTSEFLFFEKKNSCFCSFMFLKKYFVVQDYSAHQQNQSSCFGQRESNLLSNFTTVKYNTDERNVKAVASDSIFHYSAGEQVDNEANQNLQGGGIEARPAACLPVSAHIGGASIMESQDALDVSSTLSNEEEERVTHGTVSADCDGAEDETESKRR